MNLSEWQAKAETKLRSLATSARQLTPGVLYGALSTATIFPLVEAARQAIGLPKPCGAPYKTWAAA